jgi:hypothetical protein
LTYRGSSASSRPRLPGHRQPSPILRLRYHGSPERWIIGSYLAATAVQRD